MSRIRTGNIRTGEEYLKIIGKTTIAYVDAARTVARAINTSDLLDYFPGREILFAYVAGVADGKHMERQRKRGGTLRINVKSGEIIQ